MNSTADTDARPTASVASLPWYDLAELRPATDRLWAALSRRLTGSGEDDVPSSLERGGDYARHWTSPDFLFGQACGYDAILSFRDHLQVVATPHYDAEGCDGPLHCSFIVVREDAPYERVEELRGSRCTFNNRTSHSGRNALRRLVAPHHREGRFFSSVQVSGSHEESLLLIQSGEADVAAVDCVTHALLQRARPSNLEGTRVIARTAKVPAPPYVTSARTPRHVVEHLQDALAHALEDLHEETEELLIGGMEFLPLEAYEPIAEMERRAEQLGYFELDGESCSREG